MGACGWPRSGCALGPQPHKLNRESQVTPLILSAARFRMPPLKGCACLLGLANVLPAAADSQTQARTDPDAYQPGSLHGLACGMGRAQCKRPRQCERPGPLPLPGESVSLEDGSLHYMPDSPSGNMAKGSARPETEGREPERFRRLPYRRGPEALERGNSSGATRQATASCPPGAIRAIPTGTLPP